MCCEISSVAVLNLFPKRPFILPRPIWFYVFLYLKVLCSKSVSSCSCGVAGYLWSKALPFVSWFCFYLLLLLLLLCLLFCLLLFSLFLSLFILFQGSRSCFRPHPCCCCCCCSCFLVGGTAVLVNIVFVKKPTDDKTRYKTKFVVRSLLRIPKN